MVNALTPYVPGEQPKIARLTKLNTNENPYPPSPEVVQAIAQETSQLHLYPDPQSSLLCQTIADYYHLPPGYVFAGNGSDEVLAHAFCAFFRHNQPLLFPDITYSFYKVLCQLYDIPYQLVALNEKMQIEKQDYLVRQTIAGIVISNPNAPTGIELSLATIEAILQANPNCVVLVDEAYIDFGATSAHSLVEKYNNLLVTQTLSKSRSLAGMRIGFALGQEHLIEALVRVKDSFNSYPVSKIASVAGVAAFKDQVYFNSCIEKIIHARDGLILQLEDLGFNVLPSKANFVFVRHQTHNAQLLMQALRKESILVRHFSNERINNYLRITVGTPEQCQTLCQALQEIIQKS